MKERYWLYLSVVLWAGCIFLSFSVRISAGEMVYEAGNLAVDSLRVESW